MLKLLSFSNHPGQYIFHITRKYGTKVRPRSKAVADPDKPIQPRISSRMRQYFGEHELMNILELAPEEYQKRSQKTDYCTVVDPKLAKRIAFSICSRLEDGCVVESDPGFGFMSRILASVVPHLFLCERNKYFRSKLEALKMKHDNVQIISFNMCSLLRMILSVQELPSPNLTEFYQHIVDKNTSDLQKIHWIFPSMTKSSIKNLCLVHLCDSSFLQIGNMTYSIILPSTLYKILNGPISHKLKLRDSFVATLFQIILNHEILMTGIPRKMFLPWPAVKDESDDELFLIHVSPKENIKNIFDSDLLARSFIKFLQIGLTKRQRVIPLLEHYINNCGPLFILEHDMTVYTEFQDLSPEKIFSVFQTFSKLPEFSHSTFVDEDLEDYSDEPEPSEDKSDDEEESHYEENSNEMEDDEKRPSEDKDESNESMEENPKHLN